MNEMNVNNKCQSAITQLKITTNELLRDQEKGIFVQHNTHKNIYII